MGLWQPGLSAGQSGRLGVFGDANCLDSMQIKKREFRALWVPNKPSSCAGIVVPKKFCSALNKLYMD